MSPVLILLCCRGKSADESTWLAEMSQQGWSIEHTNHMTDDSRSDPNESCEFSLTEHVKTLEGDAGAGSRCNNQVHFGGSREQQKL